MRNRVRIFGYRIEDRLELGLYLSWQDRHLGSYSVGFDLFLWGFQIEFFIGRGQAPWRKGEQ